jgi:hypothetical protein
MQTINNQTPDIIKFHNQELFHVNNFERYIFVTSIHNLIIKNNKNIIKNGLNRGDVLELHSDKRPKQYKVLAFIEPLPFLDSPILVSLQYKNNFLQVDISDIKNLDAFKFSSFYKSLRKIDTQSRNC